MLPEMYQGLGMFNLNIDGLGARIFFLRQHWNMNTPISQILRQTFEAFQMNVGLEGNTFERDFSRLGKLSEACWFKKRGELCHRFQVSIIIHERYDIPLTRRRDKALMECFIDNGAYNITDLVVLNRDHKSKKIHSLADILRCDGKTVDPEMLRLQQTDIVSTRQFSIEKPTKNDKALWRQALYAITSPNLTIQDSIGSYL